MPKRTIDRPQSKLYKSGGINYGWFSDTTYLHEIHLVYPVNDETLKKYVNANFEGVEYGGTDRSFSGRCVQLQNDGYSASVIGLKKWERRNPFWMDTLVHELFHALESVFATVNIQHSKETSEVWAYTLGSYVHRSLIILP